MATVVGKGRQSLPCIVCGRLLLNVEGAVNQPYNGTSFTTCGHYGSTVFDPMDSRKRLVINVCDPCLLEAAQQRLVLMKTEVHQPPPELETVIWVPEKEEEDETQASPAAEAGNQSTR